MRKLIKPKAALWMIFFFMFNMMGCGGGGGGDSSSEAQLKKQLTSFNTAVDWVYEDMADLAETVDDLNTALESDEISRQNTKNIGKVVDRFAADTDALLASVEAMDVAEAGIQEIIDSETSLKSLLVSTIVGTGLVIYGFYSFGKKMKDLSDEASKARKDMDDAIEDIGNDDTEADGIADYEEAKKDLKDIGYEATEEFTTKVATDLILSPVNPTSTTGVIIKHVAGDELQNGLKVISSTRECEDGYDSPGCKIGIDKTDEDDSAVTPDGDAVIVVSGDDMARNVVEENIPADTFTRIDIKPVPIKDAGDDMLPVDDDTGDDDTGDTGDDDTGDDDTGDDDTGDDDTGDDDIVPKMELSAAVMEEDVDSIKYALAVAVFGVTGSTSVTLSVENAATSGATKTISADGTILWEVIVLSKDASVTVRRNDTGQTQSVTLPGKKTNYDGVYEGSAVTENIEEGCLCSSSQSMTVIVSGNRLGGEVTGTLSGNQISGTYETIFAEGSFSGSIAGNTMTGTWSEFDGCCSGYFSLTKQ